MTVIGILLIVMAVFLVIAVLMQSSKDHRHGGVVAGGAETFFGKQKGKTVDALLNKITAVVCALFFICVIVMFIVSDNGTPDVVVNDGTNIENQVTGEDNEISNDELAGDVVDDEEAVDDEEIVEDENKEVVDGEEIVEDENDENKEVTE